MSQPPRGVRPKRVPTRPVQGRIGRSHQAPPPAKTTPLDPRIVLAVGGGILLIVAAFYLGGLGGLGGGSKPAGTDARGCPTSQPAALGKDETRTVTLATEKGDIVVKVSGSLSPIATGNFVALASCGFYDGLVFHRTATMTGGAPFVIQGGDPDGTGGGGPGYTIQDEPVTATYKRGTVAMARTQRPNSQGSQFFIVLSDDAAGPLSSANTYAILGEVTSGMDVADAIYEASNGEELPADPVAMTSVTVTNP